PCGPVRRGGSTPQRSQRHMGASGHKTDDAVPRVYLVLPGDGSPPVGPCRASPGVAGQGQQVDAAGNQEQHGSLEPPFDPGTAPPRSRGIVEGPCPAKPG